MEARSEILKVVYTDISDQNGKSNTVGSEISAIQRQVSKLDGFEQTVLNYLRNVNVTNTQTREAVNSLVPIVVSAENKISSMHTTLMWILVIVIITMEDKNEKFERYRNGKKSA